MLFVCFGVWCVFLSWVHSLNVLPTCVQGNALNRQNSAASKVTSWPLLTGLCDSGLCMFANMFAMASMIHHVAIMRILNFGTCCVEVSYNGPSALRNVLKALDLEERRLGCSWFERIQVYG